jgi:hypothetical protein
MNRARFQWREIRRKLRQNKILSEVKKKERDYQR